MSRFGRCQRGWFRQDDGAAVLLDGPPWTSPADVERVENPVLLAPCVPSKIVCVGRNYVAHAKELGNAVPTEPKLFLKPPTTILSPGQAVVLPKSSALVHHEAELAFVVGRAARHVAASAAADYIFGYTCADDITARDLQRRDNAFTRGKGFDTFCPVGPYLVSGFAPQDAEVCCRVNGETRQRGRTKDMVFPPHVILAFISSIMTLLPGDLVLTGTPEGVGPLLPGDTVDIDIAGIGTLRHSVKAE